MCFGYDRLLLDLGGVLCRVIVPKVCGILVIHTAFLYSVQVMRTYMRRIFNKEQWLDWMGNMNGHLRAKGERNVNTKEEQKVLITAQTRKIVFCLLRNPLHDFHCQNDKLL
jgi:hypothetical protein